ncbi:hypothetical protein AFCA_013125 [Aspergillus flavus]|uniref:Uncharacterized protein n=1 Tax=Aspergillus flavus TaxID=5059 RepID=A0AB74CF73_ASPFL|nr:hypothetical protein NYO67_3216 [Aspergillus flavus]RMZ44145.1 hypothetical protein CA14_004366 [Aspergillus flavus]UDD65963.1 hypothetical protein AFCA_013125 [Aspergillus flavus]
MGRVEYAILQSTQIFALKTHPSHAQYDCNDINPTEDDTKTIRSIQMEHQNGQAGKSWKLSTFPAKQCIQNRGPWAKVAIVPLRGSLRWLVMGGWLMTPMHLCGVD